MREPILPKYSTYPGNWKNPESNYKLYWTNPGSNNPAKQDLHGHLPPISKTIQIGRTKPAGHCWRSKNELVSDVLLWTPSHRPTSVGPLTYLQQLSVDTGYSLEDLLVAIDDRDGWRERVCVSRKSAQAVWLDDDIQFIVYFCARECKLRNFVIKITADCIIELSTSKRNLRIATLFLYLEKLSGCNLIRITNWHIQFHNSLYIHF